MLEFVKAQISEAAEIAVLVNSAYRGDSSKTGWTTEADLLSGQRTDAEEIKKLIENPNCFLCLAKQSSQLLGCVLLEKKDKVCHLGMLTVSPTLQNQGLGKSLIKYAEYYALTSLNCTAIEMTVITKRTELLDFYFRRGYELSGEKRAFPYGNEKFGLPKVKDLEFVVLQKNLNQ